MDEKDKIVATLLKKVKLKRDIESYKNLIVNLDIFKKNIEKIVALNLDIWIKVANLNNLQLHRVLIKEAMETTVGLEEAKVESINIGNKKGSIVFVDISKSTDFFIEKENYTGFVVFNSYISLVQSYVRLSGGEFLEHTGDGSMIFYESNIINSYNNCKT